MAPILSLHKITIPATGGTPAISYFFKTKPGIYTGGVSTATGVDVAAANQQDQPSISIGELLRKGILIRVKGQYVKNNKQRTANLLCARDKVGTVLDGLENQAYNGTTIKSVSFPVQATYY